MEDKMKKRLEVLLNERKKKNTTVAGLRWKASKVFLILILAMGIGLSGAALAKEPTKKEMRADVRKMAKETLSKLYKIQPGAKKAIEKSAGYGVFSNFGMKIFFFGGGKGKGVVINKKDKKETFMKMVEAQAGLGLGAKKFRQVWVFKSQKALSDFVNSGWELGGQGTAAAKAGEQGGDLAGAISVDVDILLYQLTDEGLALELTAKGTKYYKDDKLN
jgi:lipid-binding SYLF domain-containing protein